MANAEVASTATANSAITDLRMRAILHLTLFVLLIRRGANPIARLRELDPHIPYALKTNGRARVFASITHS
jgi:hypothetical protein